MNAIVEHSTGQVIAEMTPDEARGLTERIRAGLADIWPLVLRAYEEQAWRALGYSSWNEYASAEFRGVKLALPREERKSVLQSFQDKGMSVRDMAAASGLSTGNVSQTLNPPERSEMNAAEAQDTDLPQVESPQEDADSAPASSPSESPSGTTGEGAATLPVDGGTAPPAAPSASLDDEGITEQQVWTWVQRVGAIPAMFPADQVRDLASPELLETIADLGRRITVWSDACSARTLRVVQGGAQ